MNFIRSDEQSSAQSVLLALRESQGKYAEVSHDTKSDGLRTFSDEMMALRGAQSVRVEALIRLLGDMPASLDSDSEQCKLLVAKAAWRILPSPVKHQTASLIESEENILAEFERNVWPEGDKVAQLLKKRIISSCHHAIFQLNTF